MATTDTRITPSASARDLFNKMVARADNLHLSMSSTLELAVDRKRQGRNDAEEIYELQHEAWVQQARDGGWLLLC